MRWKLRRLASRARVQLEHQRRQRLRVWLRSGQRCLHAGQVELNFDGRLERHMAQRLWRSADRRLAVLRCDREERARLLDRLWAQLKDRGWLAPRCRAAPHRPQPRTPEAELAGHVLERAREEGWEIYDAPVGFGRRPPTSAQDEIEMDTVSKRVIDTLVRELKGADCESEAAAVCAFELLWRVIERRDEELDRRELESYLRYSHGLSEEWIRLIVTARDAAEYAVAGIPGEFWPPQVVARLLDESSSASEQPWDGGNE